MNKRTSRDAIEIMNHRLLKNDPAALARVQERVEKILVARQIYDLRTEVGLTQQELAERVGTKATAISRLEDADYQGHSLSMLRRIAAALGKEVRIQFVDPVRAREPEAEPLAAAGTGEPVPA